MSTAIPGVTPFGFESSDGLGDGKALFTYGDGTIRFRHKCDRGQRGVIFCAPRLQIGNGHTLTRNAQGQATVRASIACDDCGTHGFVTDGVWADC